MDTALMSRSLRKLGLAAVLVTTLCVLAGCGSGANKANGIEKLDAGPAFLKSVDATRAAGDIEVTGRLPINGVRTTVVSRFQGDVADATLTSSAGTVQVVRSGSDIYVKAGTKFWSKFVPAAQAKSLNGKWTKSNIEGSLRSFKTFVDKDTFFRASGNIKKGAAVTVDGRTLLPITDPKDNTNSSWFIGTTGKPLLYRARIGANANYVFVYDKGGVIALPPDAIDASTFQLPIQ